MMDVRIYDFNFDLLCIMSDVISSSWSIKYNGVGTYEGHFRLNDRISDIILSTTYMIVCEGEKQAVCTGKVAERELLVCGRTINWLLTKRVIPPFKTRRIFEGEYIDPVSIMNYVLNQSFISPKQIDENGLYIDNTTDEKRVVDNFVVEAFPESETMSRHFWRNSANTVEDVLKDLCDMMNIGHCLYFDVVNKTWTLKPLCGEEKNIIISEHNRNFYNVTYTEDIGNYAASGWFEDTSTNIEEVEDEEDASAWKYMSHDDGNTGMLFWETVLSGVGVSEAQAALNAKQMEYTVKGTVSKMKFMKDYNLGDTVRIYIRLGGFERKIEYKITGVNIWYNQNSAGEEPVFERVLGGI